MTEDFLHPEDQRWSDVLRHVRHDVYHLPSYTSIASSYEGGQPVAFYARDGNDILLVPLLLRQVPHNITSLGELWDASSPYGYPSPLFSRPDRMEACRNLIAVLVQALRDKGLITLFLRMHPLLNQPLGDWSQVGDLVQHGWTVSIDLQRPLEALISETSNNHRRGIRKLSKAGFSAVLDNWDDYPTFISLYRQTMKRVGARPFYLFEGTYFDQLRELLGSHLHLCSVIAPTGELAAGGLFTEVDGLMEYHLGGSRTDFPGLAPSKMMFDFMRRWGHAQRFLSLHLGGGLGGCKDSLFDFKAGFSSRYSPFHTFRLVLDHSVYATLCDAWTKATGQEKANDNFFPLYKKPEKPNNYFMKHHPLH
jgi:hypothetical protein